uniref:EGF-like domain-containing protein n=1 Tax=Macrostomum lignano TaxID=282301 RepID=A0A1I8F804_9PLAT
SSSASPTRQAATGASATAIEPRTAESSCFRLDPSAGLLSLEFQKLDREANPLHRIVIVARDCGEPPLSASPHGRQRQPPEFEQPSPTVNLSEAVPVGHVITRLRATSRDTGRNAEIRYRLLDSAGLFNLSELTGQEGLTGVSSGSSRRPSFTACAGRDVNLAASALPRSQLVIPELRVIAAVPSGGHLLCSLGPTLPFAGTLLGPQSAGIQQREAAESRATRLFVSERTAPLTAGESAVGMREVAALKVFFGPEREMLGSRRSGWRGRGGRRGRRGPNKGDKARAGPWPPKLDFERQQRHHATVRAFDLGDSPSSAPPRWSRPRSRRETTTRRNSSATCTTPACRRTRSRAVPPGRQPDRTDADSGDNGRLAYSIESGNSQQLFSLDMSNRPAVRQEEADPRGQGLLRLTNRYADAISGNGRSDGGPAADGSVLHVSDCDAPPNGGPFSWSLVDGGGHGKFLVDQRGRLRVNINLATMVKAEEQIIVQACDGGQRTLCGRAKLFVRTVRADQLTPSLLPSNLTAVLAYPAAGGEKLGRLRLRHPSPKGRPAAAAQPLGSVQPGTQRGVVGCHGDHPARRAAPGSSERQQPGPGSEQEVRVRVTLLTEAMAESAVPLHLGGGSAHGFFLDRRDAQLAEQLTAQLRARRGRSGAPAGCAARLWGRRAATAADGAESRRGFLDPAEVRSRLNSSEAVRSLLPEAAGVAGLAAEARRDRRLLVETAGITFTAPEFRLAPTCGTAKLKGAPPSGAVFGFFPGGSEGGEGAAWALAEWQQLRGLELRLRTRQSRPGRLLRVSGCGGWRLALRLHADGDGRLEATAAVSGGGGTKTATVRSCCGSSAAAGERRSLAPRAAAAARRLLTDSIEPQLGQLPALPASSLHPGTGASTLRVELDRFVGCLTDLLSWPAATRLTAATAEAEAAARRGCPEAELAAPCASTPCQHEGVCTEVGVAAAASTAAASRPTPGPRCELNLRPCDHRPCLNGGACRDFGDGRGGFACDCPAGAAGPRCELVDRGGGGAATASCGGRGACQHGGWWPGRPLPLRGHRLCWARCATATSTSADRPSAVRWRARRLRQLPGRVQVGGRRIWCECPSGFTGTACERLPGQPGAAIDGGASASEQPLLLGLRFHELAAVLGCVSSLLLLALAVFCLVSCYGKRRRGRRRRALAGLHVAHQRSGGGGGCQDDPGEEAMALMPMMAPPMINGSCGGQAASLTYAGFETPLPPPLTLLQLRGLRGPCRSCSGCSGWGGVGPMSPQKPPPLLSFPRSCGVGGLGGRGFSGELVDDQGYHWDLSSPEQQSLNSTKPAGYHWDLSSPEQQSLNSTKPAGYHWDLSSPGSSP